MTEKNAIPDCDSCIFLNNVCDRIAVAVMSSKWMSRYCEAPPVSSIFSFPHLKTLYKGKQREEERVAQNRITSFLAVLSTVATSENTWRCLALFVAYFP